MITRHGKRLVEDRDFVIVDQSVKMNWNGIVRATDKIWLVWLVNDDVEAYICPGCFKITSPTPRGVLGHLKVHRAGYKSRISVKRQAAAFRLLPAKVQRTMLARLDEQEKHTASEDGSGAG